jgi:hypothetical protein
MQKRFLSTALILVLCSACTPALVTPDSIPVAPTPTQPLALVINEFESTQTPIANPTPEGDEDECNNPFYPVSDEAVWMYSHSDGTNSISTMSADDFGKFTITAEGAGSTFTIDGECTPEGIVIMSNPGAATTYSGEYGNSTVSTVDVSGVTLPKEIGQGEQWSQTLTTSTEAGQSVIETSYTALGFENITVPAGDFYTLKVEQSGYVTVLGQKVAMHGVQWFAEGVGVVKSAMDGAPVVELTMYDIPN